MNVRPTGSVGDGQTNPWYMMLVRWPCFQEPLAPVLLSAWWTCDGILDPVTSWSSPRQDAQGAGGSWSLGCVAAMRQRTNCACGEMLR
jgi:hypothetical protein